MELAARPTIRPRLLAVALAAIVLCLAAVAALKNGLGPTLPLGIIFGVLVAVSVGCFILAIGGERVSTDDPSLDEDDNSPAEEERVRAYRERQFLALGVSDELAPVLALQPAVSAHALARLIERGCPVGTAVRILWPE